MTETVTIPKHIYTILIASIKHHFEDVSTGLKEGIYEAGEDNNRLLADLEEAIEAQPVKRGITVYNLTDPTYNHFPLGTFSEFEIHPCIEEDTHVTQIDENDTRIPDFWSVYLRYSPDTYQPNSPRGGLDCIADTDTKEEAEAFKALLENLVSKYKPE